MVIMFKAVLFCVFMYIQGTILTEYPLEWVWLDHLLAQESPQQLTSQTYVNCLPEHFFTRVSSMGQ